MMESKETLRARYKRVRAEVSSERRAEAKDKTASINCGNEGPVMSFASLPHEIDTSMLNQRLLSEGRLVVPSLVDDHIICRRVRSLEDLVEGRFGILESKGTLIDPEEIVFALIPGVVFDIFGGRIGHGFGFYDRLLPHLKCKIGLCFKEQIVEDRLPADSWDIPVDSLIAL